VRARAYPRRLGLIAGAIIFTALNLRTAIASVPPLLDEIRATVPLSATAAGVLTTAPVVCMAVGSPMAPPLARRIGAEAAITTLGLTVAAGILLRLIDGVVPLFAGTIVAGLGIALGNVLVPSLIKRDFPDRVGPMTGGYTMAISASGAIAAALTVPAEDAIGRGWQWGLVVWAIPAVAAALIWVPWIARRGADAGAPAVPSLWRNRIAWQVTVYMGLQSLLFYSALSWLPTLLRDHGIDREAAGTLLSVMLLAGVPTCLIVPVFATRGRDQRPAVVARRTPRRHCGRRCSGSRRAGCWRCRSCSSRCARPTRRTLPSCPRWRRASGISWPPRGRWWSASCATRPAAGRRRCCS
jgi:CP family cyanate transporter-like MFS transporter